MRCNVISSIHFTSFQSLVIIVLFGATSTMAGEVGKFDNYVDLIANSNGGRILFATDDWFAPAENLLKDEAPIFKDGLFTDFGKWMDGWETRRRRKPGHDWCIIKLGVPGVVKGVEIDTGYFTGNYAPRFSLQAARLSQKDEEKIPDRPKIPMGTECTNDMYKKISKLRTEDWNVLIPMSTLRPGYEGTRTNYFEVHSPAHWTHLRLNIYPDGGIARLRIYGHPRHKIKLYSDEEVDLIAIGNGGVCASFSNAHYGHPKNLIRPGRGKNMGDGWETARRLDRPPVLEVDANNILQVPGDEWAIFKFGYVGTISRIIVDSAHFKGNYPDSVKIEGAFVENVSDEINWRSVLPQSKMSPHKIHEYEKDVLKNDGPFTHVKITIAPDGGISRLRIFGFRERLSNF